MSTIVEPPAAPGLYRLIAWLSPGFPTGAFSYSHGVEAAAAATIVDGRDSLMHWIAALVAQGSGRIDADILCNAYRAALAGDAAALERANRRGLAYRPTAELALEAAQQGGAFVATCRAAWPDAIAAEWDPRDGACHSAAFGAAAAGAGVALRDAVIGYLQAFAANLIAAALRLGLLGQTDGQRITAALEPLIVDAADAAIVRDPGDFGAATFAADLLSMTHETQYSRLFRS